jgi:hypothetical protein
LVAAVAVLTALGVLVVGWALGPERHVDGEGSLASLTNATRIGMSAPAQTTTAVTFGLRLCIADATDRIIIESVGPTEAVGSGVEYLGSRYRFLDFQGDGAGQDTIGSVEGFPPPSIAPETLVEAVGAELTYHCEPEYPTAYPELLLGFRGGPGLSGGWHGIDVGYRAGWRHRVVSIRYDLLLCGAVEADCAEELIP